jgi:glycosyltransferase involved in cell wall biosynthesis
VSDAPSVPKVGAERPFTVLILNPMGGDGWGGVERWFMDTAEGLRARGHRVLSVGRPGSLWTQRTAARGFPTRLTDMKSDFAPGEARAIAHWIQEEGVEVICTKLHRGIRLAGLSAMFARPRPKVVAFMGLVEVKRGWRYSLTYSMFLDRILTLAPSMKREIEKVGKLPASMVEAIPYGITPGDYVEATEAVQEARRSLIGDAPGPLLLAAGRLHAQKRFDLLLEAFATVRERVPKARLAIVGTGSLREDLETRARDLGVAESVTFAGFRADMPAVLSAADLFVLSSDDEGLPMVVLEAMAAGRAVVATRVGALEDMVDEGKSGVLVPRGDPAALAEAVIPLLKDDEQRTAMGTMGRAIVATRYPLDRCLLETENYLLRVGGRG